MQRAVGKKLTLSVAVVNFDWLRTAERNEATETSKKITGDALYSLDAMPGLLLAALPPIDSCQGHAA